MKLYRQVSRTISHLFHPQRANNYRAKLLHPEMLLFLAMFIVMVGLGLVYFSPIFSQKMGAVLGYAADISQADVISQTNAQRMLLGLPPLKESRLLDQAAYLKAQDMFNKQYWAHVSPEGVEPWSFFKQVGYEYRYAGENLAKDFATTESMVLAWMKSPKHKENIINPHYTQIGVAVKNGVLNGVETTLVVQMFGSPRNGLPSLASGDETTQSNPAKLSNTTTEFYPAKAQVLSKTESLLPEPEFSPLILVKSLLLSIGVMLVAVLVYDLVMIRKKHALRVVGKNLAHLMFLVTVMFLIFFFKSGSIN